MCCDSGLAYGEDGVDDFIQLKGGNMNGKIITVSIIGVGLSGGESYGRHLYRAKDKYKITDLCDIDGTKLKKYGDAFEVDEARRFLTEESFFQEKRSDLLVIATMEKTHIRIARKALSLGYDIMLEQPVSDEPDELRSLVAEAHRTGRKIMVCHVLRYSSMVRKLRELLTAGEIGRIISMDATENVVFWHEAHGFVRGNWRKSEISTSMVVTKCCHDLDLLQYFAGSKCMSVTSMGSLSFFKEENAPAVATKRCVDCPLVEACPYSAKKIYIDLWKQWGMPANVMPMNALTDTLPLTEEALMKAVQEGPYGRCVFYCDNDVVDTQKIIMQFENGITATLKMEAFVKYGGRELRFFGTHGYLELNERLNLITLHRYLGADDTWSISSLEGTDDHAFRVGRMIDAFYDVLIGESEEIETSIDGSVESHYMAIAAEESRLSGGKPIELEKYRTGKALVKDMLAYIQTHYLEDITMATVAQAVGYSTDYCSKALRSAVGYSFRDYVNLLRIKKAEEMLADKSLRLTTLEILYRCGFNNSATYYRAKKKLESEGRIVIRKGNK